MECIMHKKLFIPGPVEVYPDALKVMGTPMIGHRTKDYSTLHGRVKEKIQKFLYTKNKVFFSTSSGTGVMEACLRNCVAKRAACFPCGAFGERWYKMAAVNGKEADNLGVEMGKAIKPEVVDKALSTGKYDVALITHNETSSGVMNPLEEIGNVLKKYPDVLFLVDAVSAMAGAKIEVDKWGIDVCLASTQKGFALPPGFSLFSISEKALARAKQVPNRGYYFDFLEFDKFDAKNQTPTTPSISHLYALDHQLDKFFAEGLDKRFERHQKMAKMCRDWVIENGFKLFPEPGYESVTMTTADNTRNIDIGKINAALAEKGFVISAGYGKLKATTFRIAHMGDTQPEELSELLVVLKEIIGAHA